MKSKFYLFAGVGLLAFSSSAQSLKTDYIQWPESGSFPTYVKDWKPGEALFEDENFFISRVKAKPLIARNVALQVNKNITDDNDKRVIMWVPIGNTNLGGVHTDALPTGMYDSEAFSYWSYVDHFGDWTSPHGWVPGGFADAAHKHGTAVSGVASIPWGSINDSWKQSLQNQNNLDKEKVAKFLYFHGVNGLGYNSEFYAQNTLVKGVRDLHEYLYKWMADKDPIFENVWYDGTDDNGNISFDNGLGNHNQLTFGDGENRRSSLFFNYNWWRTGLLDNSVTNARNLGRNSFELYAGCNMQGGDPSFGYTVLKDLPISIGFWGAHDFNYLWAPRSKYGSTPESMQKTYQMNLEYWFTNGHRNPADAMDVYDTGLLAPNEKWFGISAYKSARSTLGWDLTDEPFVTYFNLGNGRFFNLEGERQNDREWYSIGIQDYMPTWRWWFSSTLLGNTPEDVPAEGLTAEFTWDDAWFGGSCLNIKGSTADEYLHLFRTQFGLKSADVITVRYKVLGGKGNVNLALSNIGAESTLVRENQLKLLTATDETDSDEWVTKTFKISGQLASFNNKQLALVALHFTDAENLNILLGEFSITRGTYATPVAPVITSVKYLAYNNKGVDAKVIFNMPNNKAADEPCYNSDVNASMFRIYTQQEGQEPVLMGASSSWAHIVYQAPVASDGATRMRVGVQAVSLDHKSASDIVWSEYSELPAYEYDSSIQINKPAIKPNEAFEVSFVDPKQEATTWQLFNTAGEKLAEQEGTALVMENGLPEVGGYDVVVFAGTSQERRYAWFVQVSDFDKGAVPEIKTLTINGNDVDSEGEITLEQCNTVALGYTGREADGIGSRGIQINQGFVGVPVGDVTVGGNTITGAAIDPLTSFGAAAWIKFDLPKGEDTSLFQIENRAGSWPANNWGWCWFMITEEGKINIRFRGTSLELGYYYDDAYVTPGAWTHVAFSFEYVDSKFNFRLFINGVEKECYLYGEAGGGGVMPSLEGPAQPIDHLYAITQKTDWLSFGGGRGSSPLYNDGVIDDLVIWDSAVTVEDVKLAMDGFGEVLPDNVMSFWSFEDDADEVTNCFVAKGKVPAMASQFGLVQGSGEGQATQTPQAPIYESGCPFIPGSAYPVVTVPTWSGKKARITGASGSDVEGKADVSFTGEGDYTVTLKLSNSHGSDSRTYPVIAVTTGIDDIAADGSITAYTVQDAVIVEFAEAGDYVVTVYDLSGAVVNTKAASVNAFDNMTIGVGADGIYLVKVVRGAETLRTFKLIKR